MNSKNVLNVAIMKIIEYIVKVVIKDIIFLKVLIFLQQNAENAMKDA